MEPPGPKQAIFQPKQGFASTHFYAITRFHAWLALRVKAQAYLQQSATGGNLAFPYI